MERSQPPPKPLVKAGRFRERFGGEYSPPFIEAFALSILFCRAPRLAGNIPRPSLKQGLLAGRRRGPMVWRGIFPALH